MFLSSPCLYHLKKRTVSVSETLSSVRNSRRGQSAEKSAFLNEWGAFPILYERRDHQRRQRCKDAVSESNACSYLPMLPTVTLASGIAKVSLNTARYLLLIPRIITVTRNSSWTGRHVNSRQISCSWFEIIRYDVSRYQTAMLLWFNMTQLGDSAERQLVAF